MEFHGTVHQSGKTATGIEVPEQVVTDLGSTRRPAVRVTINGYTYRSTIAPMAGSYWIPVSAEVRERAGVSANDQVEVGVELDTEPREIEVPSDFAAAIEADVDAKKFFDGLSYSKKRWHVLSVESAKTDETRQRRIAKSIDMLHEGKG
jgi:hypothetical protein